MRSVGVSVKELKKMKLRNVVIAMLILTVLSPILLYTHKFQSYTLSSSNNDFLQDVTAFTFPGDSNHLNVLPHQESSSLLKEPIGIVFTDNSTTLLHSPPASDVKLKDGNGGREHKSARALSTTKEEEDHSSHLPDPAIRQVTGTIATNRPQQKRTRASNQFRNFSQTLLGKKPAVTLEKSDEKDSLSSKNGRPVENRVKPDARVCQLRDQLIRAKVYLTLPATKNNPHFTRELRLRMKEVQRVLGDSSKDSDLPRGAIEKLKAMDKTLAKGQQMQDDCAVMVKKLRAMFQSSEEQLRAHKKQTVFLTQLTAKTLPKGLHCLPLQLTAEYYSLNSSEQQFSNQEKLDDPQLYHYALFSDNVLAAAVVVNSTISHAKDPSKHVFHIVSDRLNYAAMRMWFLANPPGKATVQVQNIDEFTWLNASYSPVLRQLGSQSMIDYYFRGHRASSDKNLKYRNPKYLSILNHLRFYLPEVFPKLDKVLFLDDDVVVQKDLSDLWSLDLKGNVNGAVETCGESFHRFDRYLNFSNPLISKNFDARACGWAYGMNVFDLNEWRRQNITDVYHSWQKLNHDRLLWKLGTLPPGLITFWKRTYPLERSWHVLGLGYNPNVNQREIEGAAVIHYNGNMKPWLEIGLTKYRNYWAKYVDYDQVYLRECNISP